MSENLAHWNTSREITERVVVTGKLVLLTPTHLGSGEAAGPTDMSLLRDPLTETSALLTGASITGALRNYLRELEHGYGKRIPKDKPSNSPVVQLFGGQRGYDGGAQSLLIVDDALSESAAIEVRDGVRIDPKRGTAMVEETDGRKKGYKFDLELLQAGVSFSLRFELLIPQGREQVKTALARALQGLEKGEIALGARKRRGFGRCKVKDWRVVSFDLTTPDGLMNWLQEDDAAAREGEGIADLLQVSAEGSDLRESFRIKATFYLDGSMLIRADAESGADAGHLHSVNHLGERVPVLSGTSLAGVLRHRALRIANTLAPDGDGGGLVETMFGRSPQDGDEGLTASRVIVRETAIEGVQRLVQSRVQLDRFTGGAYPTALFSEEPIFGGQDSRVEVDVSLRNPKDHEVGLLLLLLKDLWTGDLTVGGERSVGRGRLAGVRADLHWKDAETDQPWELIQTESGLSIEDGPKERLDECVQALVLEGGSR